VNAQCDKYEICIFFGRHCLWIVGNGITLSISDSVWRRIVNDAQDRGCFFDVYVDKHLSDAVAKAIIELDAAEDSDKVEPLQIRRSKFQVFQIVL
jgi:hypothetical protein